jgi:hypothetical protein
LRCNDFSVVVEFAAEAEVLLTGVPHQAKPLGIDLLDQ